MFQVNDLSLIPMNSRWPETLILFYPPQTLPHLLNISSARVFNIRFPAQAECCWASVKMQIRSDVSLLRLPEDNWSKWFRPCLAVPTPLCRLRSLNSVIHLNGVGWLYWRVIEVQSIVQRTSNSCIDLRLYYALRVEQVQASHHWSRK